jgi:UPF0755 protein
MIGIKKQKTILAFSLILAVMIFFTCVYFLIIWLPSSAARLFGEPEPGLDTSHRILLSARLLMHRKNLATYLELGDRPITFSIDPGQSASIVAEKLETMGIIPDANFLVNYWLYKGQDRLIQTGVYLIQPDTTPLSIAVDLVNNSPEEIHFAFLAGWRKEEIENLLHTTGIFSHNIDFWEVEKSSLSYCFSPEFRTLSSIEGFLFPGEYQLPVDLSQKEILCSFTERFFESIPPNYEELVNKQGLTFYEAVILASIVQREVISIEEAPIIAGIFINRLDAHMSLQSDPTVQYAIASDTEQSNWWKSPLESADLQVNSTYNTYINNGLPPSPICNPDLNSLLAIAFPKRTNYLFFRASCDQSGTHIFSETYQQHVASACD